MASVRTVSLDWVNKGRAFEVSAGQFTPADYRQGILAKTEMLKRLTTGLSDMPDEVRQEVIGDARIQAQIAQFNAMIHSFLARLDSAVAALSDTEVQERLTLADYEQFVEAMGGKKAGPAAAGEGRPLAKPAA